MVSLMIFAWLIEIAFGWPDWVFRRIRHPVVRTGALITQLERSLNRAHYSFSLRHVFGVIATLIVSGITTGMAILISWTLPDTIVGYGIEAVIISSLLASRSLYTHLQQVARPLIDGKLADARVSVSRIVGRNNQQLNSNDVCRAALESLAENTSDGVVAPLFWGVIFGLPGIAAYKAINTLDSMIGHRSDEYLAFGGFAARLDDVANFIPARLTGVFFAMASLRVRPFRIMWQQAKLHRSPNAGWPESAMAAGLNVRLSGPRNYDDFLSDEPWLNPEGAEPVPVDVEHGMMLYIKSMLLFGLVLLCLAITQVINSWA